MLSRRLLLPGAARNAALGAAVGGHRIVAGGGTVAAAAAGGVGALQSWQSPLRYYTEDSGQLKGSRRFSPPTETTVMTSKIIAFDYPKFPRWLELKQACAERDFASALTLLQKHDGGAREYAHLIDAFIKAGQLDRAEKIFLGAIAREDDVAMQRIRPDAALMMNQIVKRHLQDGRFLRAWKFFHTVTVEGPPHPSYKTGRGAFPKISSSIQRIAPKQRIMPNADSYSMLLRGCGQNKKGREAVELVDEATSFGIKLSAWAMSWVVTASSAAMNTKDAWRFLRYMKEEGLHIKAETFYHFLDAKAAREENCEDVLDLMEWQGYHPSVRTFKAAAMYRQALEFYDSLSQKERGQDDYHSALAAAGKLQDAERVTAILVDIEMAESEGIALTLLHLPHAHRVFYCSPLDADEEEDEQGRTVGGGEGRKVMAEESSQERQAKLRCLDTIKRLTYEKELFCISINLIHGFQQYGRQDEAVTLIGDWMKRRLSKVKDKAELTERLRSYAAVLNGLGMLAMDWPVVIYLFDEALLIAKGFTPTDNPLVRGLIRALTQEEKKAKRHGEEGGAEVMHEFVLSAYRQMLDRGQLTHMHLQTPGWVDVHRMFAGLALLAVETFLRDEALKMLEGGADVNKDLYIVTGRGIHARFGHAAAPLASYVQGGGGRHVGKEQTLSGHSSGKTPVMKLRNKLARLLAEKYSLFSSAELAELAMSVNRAEGYLVISKEKKMKWIKDYLAQNPSLSSRPPPVVGRSSKKKAPKRGGSAAKR